MNETQDIQFKDLLNSVLSVSGLERKEVCEELEIPYTTLQNWTVGKRVPSLVIQKMVLDFLEEKALLNVEIFLHRNKKNETQDIQFKDLLNSVLSVSGLEKKEVCEELEIKYRTLQSWTLGKRVPNLETQKIVLDFLEEKALLNVETFLHRNKKKATQIQTIGEFFIDLGQKMKEYQTEHGEIQISFTYIDDANNSICTVEKLEDALGQIGQIMTKPNLIFIGIGDFNFLDCLQKNK